MMSEELKRQIGQHFVFGFEGYEPNEAIIKLIRDYHVGNVIIFKRNIKDKAQIHGLVQNLQQIAKDAGHPRPLLFGIDQENGLTSAFSRTGSNGVGTQFPGAMAMGTTGDLSLAEEISAAAARELRWAGINWVYSPVADVNSDPRNPVIGVRSFGEDAKVAADFVCAVRKGIEREGLAATAKHFPGHGDTHVDSHLALPVIAKSLQSLEQTELVPFRASIKANISSIMTGHIALPKLASAFGIDPEQRPASLSRSVVTSLLREKLGFKGVVVTDCLEMDAISAGIGCGPGAVLALQAGTDIVMICHRFDRQLSALEATYSAFEKGLLSWTEFQDSATRVGILKEKVAGSWNDVLGRTFDSRALTDLMKINGALAKSAYSRTTRWLTPFTAQIGKYDNVLVFTPQMEAINPAVDDPQLNVLLREPGPSNVPATMRNTAGPSYVAFAEAIAGRAPFSTHAVYIRADAEEGLPEALEKQILSATSIVFTTRNAHQESSMWQLKVLMQLVDIVERSNAEDGTRRPIRVILFTSCAPYDFQLFQADPKTRDLPCLCTYEFTKPALEEAAAKLYGETLAR